MSLVPNERDQGFNEAVALMQPQPKYRAHYLPADSLFGLHHACQQIDKSYDGFGCYLVGSCMERKEYRDVDVRCILGDDELRLVCPDHSRFDDDEIEAA